jgi:hypothetical protein
MLHLATPIVDWNAMWKIFLVALAAGAGTVIAFGFVLLGLKFSQGPPTYSPASDGTGSVVTGHTAPSAGARLGGFTLSLVCGLIVVGVVVVGVYAMTQKPKSKPAAKPKSALVIPAGSGARLIASSG